MQLIARFGEDPSYAAPLVGSSRQAGGKTYKSRVVTVSAPGAVAIRVNQTRTDGTSDERYPLGTVQIGLDSWQALTMDEVEGARVGSARIRIEAEYPGGIVVHRPAQDSRPRHVGKDVSISVTPPAGIVIDETVEILDEVVDVVEGAIEPGVLGEAETEGSDVPIPEVPIPEVPGEGRTTKDTLIAVGGTLAAVAAAAAGWKWWQNRGDKGHGPGNPNRW